MTIFLLKFNQDNSFEVHYDDSKNRKRRQLRGDVRQDFFHYNHDFPKGVDNVFAFREWLTNILEKEYATYAQFEALALILRSRLKGFDPYLVIRTEGSLYSVYVSVSLEGVLPNSSILYPLGPLQRFSGFHDAGITSHSFLRGVYLFEQEFPLLVGRAVIDWKNGD